jgi:3'(2'), 5'-bisphosphate nucleotidase
LKEFTLRTDSCTLDLISRFARNAGEAIMDIYQGDFRIETKDDDSPLTCADRAAHNIIVSSLREHFPDIPILSEEDVEGFPGPDEKRRYWLVDPLDGTKEFIKRNGEFTVNIALIEKGRPVLGVVHAPALDVTYMAARGLGAFRQGDDGVSHPIGVATHVKGDPWRIVGSRSHAGDSLNTFAAKLGTHELVPMGSSLKLCLVAEGLADVYPRLGATSLWDTAAAQCVVEEAGGAVIRPDGQPLDYGDPAEILNPYFLVHGRSWMDWSCCFS